jgi:peptidyl-prolyl cis-trans isomerase C
MACSRAARSPSFCAFLVAGALLLAGCGGSSSGSGGAPYTIGESISDSTIAAISTSNDLTDTLTYDDLERRMSGMSQRMRQPLSSLPDSVRQQIQRNALLSFMSSTAQTAEARERGLTPDSNAVGRQIRRLRQRMGGDSTMRARLSQRGVTMKQLRADIEQYVLSQSLQEELSSEAPAPSAEELRQYRRDKAQQVRLQQILFSVPPRGGPGQRDSVQQRAQAVLDSIQSGAATFAQMAERYGQNSGGALTLEGYQTRAQLGQRFAQRGQQNPSDAPFVQAAFALEDSGAVAEEPVRTRYGYHLVRQTGKRTGPLPDSARAAQELAEQQSSEYLQEQIRALMGESTLRINPDRVTADMTQPLKQDSAEGGGSAS